MPSELVEVLDKNKKFIKSERVHECHENGLWHRSVGVFIFNEKKELLLQKRNQNMYVSPGRYCCSASGHVSYGENIEYSAYKELKEELGIETKLNLVTEDILEKFNQRKIKLRHFFSLFKGYHEGPFDIQKSELNSVNFFGIAEIKEMLKNNPHLFTTAFKLSFEILS